MAVTTIAAEIKTPAKYVTYPVAANSLDLTMVAPTAFVDGVDFTATGKEIVVIQNTGGSPGTVTILSSADAYGRTGDITAYVLAAGAIAVFAPPPDGWANPSTRKITITMSAATIKVGIIRSTNPM